MMAHGSNYIEFSSAGNSEMHGFELNHELFGLQSTVDMYGIPSIPKQQSSNLWGGFFPRDLTESSNKNSTVVSAVTTNPYQQHQPFQLSNFKYFTPARELLNEFCSLGGDQSSSRKRASQSSSNPLCQSLYSMDLLELHKRKEKLVSMLQEVDRRYKKYSDQMQDVMWSFDALAGGGAATIYSKLASRAMSRHFRRLRDAIIGQIRASKKAMEEKETVAAAIGAARGETPRLKVLDRFLQKEKGFQQGYLMENQPCRPQRSLPGRAVSILRAWLFEHFLNPYPTDVDKHILSRQTGLSRSQVSNWFINARVRLWKPMVEEMYMKEMKEEGEPQDSTNENPNPSIDKKLPPKQLLVGSDSLSSVVDGSHQRLSGSSDFNIAELDFSSYNKYGGQSLGGSISLTLGLQHHSGGGMSLSFTPASEHPLFDGGGGQPMQFSVADHGKAQVLPYRNLMGSHIMHDFAG
ncbi:homeobox protein BEL1 homolog [Typha latifolia]|uniref:homeobox protein BEL1 homolog n=1 Tax=Typha latifolia TaxID=4733 RepID=UPI003C302492